MQPSSKPFNEALRGLMDHRGASVRKLAALTAAGGHRGLSASYLGQLLTKQSKPTVENMEQVSRALGEDPTFFREYREHVASQRAAVLAARLGLDVVLAKLAELDED